MSTSKLLKNSGIYIFVSVLQKAISFFLLPVYTVFLTPADYGTLNVIISISSLLSVFFLLSLNSAGARFYYQYLDDEQHIKKIWGALCVFVVINSIILGTFFIVFHHYLIDPFVSGIDFFPFMLLGILSTILTPLYLFFQAYLQTRQDSIRYGVNMILNFLLNIGLIILFVVVFKKGVLGILLAGVITSFVFFVYVLISFIPRLILNLDKNILIPAFKYSLPLVPHSLSSWLMSMVDRLLVNNFTGKTEAGLYSVGYQFGNIINIITTSVNQAYAPWFFEREKKGELNQAVKIAELLTVIYCFLALGISLFASDVLSIMVTRDFRSAWVFIPFISFAYVFSGLYYFFVNVLFLRQTKYVPIITFSSAIIGLILNIILIQKIGSLGASISCFISLLASSIIALFFSIKADKIRYNYARMYIYIFLFFTVSLIVYIPFSFNYLHLFLLKTLIYVLMMIIFIFIYKNEIFMLKSLLKKNEISG